MNTDSATVHFAPEVDAWMCTGVTNGKGDQRRFHGTNAKDRAIEYASQHFKHVTVIEQT